MTVIKALSWSSLVFVFQLFLLHGAGPLFSTAVIMTAFLSAVCTLQEEKTPPQWHVSHKPHIFTISAAKVTQSPRACFLGIVWSMSAFARVLSSFTLLAVGCMVTSMKKKGKHGTQRDYEIFFSHIFCNITIWSTIRIEAAVYKTSQQKSMMGQHQPLIFYTTVYADRFFFIICSFFFFV